MMNFESEFLAEIEKDMEVMDTMQTLIENANEKSPFLLIQMQAEQDKNNKGSGNLTHFNSNSMQAIGHILEKYNVDNDTVKSADTTTNIKSYLENNKKDISILKRNHCKLEALRNNLQHIKEQL